MCPTHPLSRRAFLRVLFKGGFLALAGAALYRVLRYLIPPKGVEASVASVVAAKVGGTWQLQSSVCTRSLIRQPSSMRRSLSR